MNNDIEENLGTNQVLFVITAIRMNHFRHFFTSDCHDIYHLLIHSEFKTYSQVTLVISDEFNRNKVLEAIANISLPFLAFLKEIAEAGIVTYRVYISEKQVTYIGIGEEKIEEQLKI
ncbi:hypothetical protein V7087_25900 [Neobacillus niacini]|uniref:hypothetical protein n=1 Tax=Neobacillus niacini TaxID=86668 RepID=UPI002FFE7049